MDTLFPILDETDIPQIAGLSYHAHYITESEERELVSLVDAAPWDTSWERRRQPYGVSYGQKDGAAKPIPDWGRALANRMHREGLSDRPFDQMLINEYLPGQGIALHQDHQPFDRTVVSLSLLAPCVMDLQHANRQRRERLLLERRSLLVLSDEARYQWQHGIARRKNDSWKGILIPRSRRISVTFRLRKQ